MGFLFMPSATLFLHLQTLLFFYFFTVSANIPLGSTLRASNPNQTWSSPNINFSVGFIPSPSDPTSSLAAISYRKSLPIWVAGGDRGAVDSGASLELLSTGNLRLLNGPGAVVWESRTGNLGVSSANLDDSGNLVLRNATGLVWSSFANPTDTIAPSQNFSVGMMLRSGVYSFTLQPSGNLSLMWNNNITYKTIPLNGSFDGNLTKPYIRLTPAGTLDLFDPPLTSDVIMAYSDDYGPGDIFRFIRLDGDGNLRIYSYPATATWAAVEDQCKVYGYCGDLGVCSYNDSGPVCGCPSQNFDPIDPNDLRKGCKRKVRIEDCPGSPIMLELKNAQFLTYPTELSSQSFYIGLPSCRSYCLTQNANSCIASTSLGDGTGLCYLKVPGFFSGYQSPALPSTSFLKVCGPVAPNPVPSLESREERTIWKLRGWIVAVAILSTLVVLVILEGFLWWWCCRNSPKFGSLSAQYALLEYASGAPVQFSYKDLQRSTKGFKEKLGEGGFGAVYRGILVNKTIVAVKQLEGIEQGEKQFRMEVATISSTHHLNLVRLIGFCSEGRHRLLVYEFMRNGSLDYFLFAKEEQSARVLNWEYRFNIALGTARGITYLHEECRDCIVHCDIKPENILIDENFNAKVSDFGLAKLINPKDHRHRTLTSVRGTRGYLAPEWIANLPITSKSDVYSYGMVLLEIVSGRRNFEVSAETGHRKFSAFAYEEFEKGNVMEMIDKRLAENDVDVEQLTRAIQVSFWCIQEQPSQRPTMGKVVQMLEGITAIEKPPPPKGVTVGSFGSANTSSTNISGAPSVPSEQPLSSSSSFRTSGVSSFVSGRAG